MNAYEQVARGLRGGDRNINYSASNTPVITNKYTESNYNPYTSMQTAEKIARGLYLGGRDDNSNVSQDASVGIDLSKLNNKQNDDKKTNGTGTATIPTTDAYGNNSGYSYNNGYDYASMINQMLESQRAAAEESYNRARGNLDNAWGNTKSTLDANIQNTRNQLSNAFNYGQKVANDDAAKSLREAYINYMMNKKNMNQNLSVAGISGGATESSLANLYNNYGNSRNNINEGLSSNLANLLNTYQNNLANAEQTYNSTLADAMNNYTNNLNNLEMALSNNQMASYSGSSLANLSKYASVLAGLNGGMYDAAGNYIPTTNTLQTQLVNSEQNGAMQSQSNYAKYRAMKDALTQSGATKSQIISALMDSGASEQELISLFS